MNRTRTADSRDVDTTRTVTPGQALPVDGDVPSQRRQVSEILNRIREEAQRSDDVRLLLVVDLLMRVYGLFEDGDRLAERGSAMHQARVAVHNAITGGLGEWADWLEAAGLA